MITRIRISGIRPGTLAVFTEVARDWKSLLEGHGGRVLGFYFDETENKVTGIAEYDSRSRLREIQRKTGFALGVLQYHLNRFDSRDIESLNLGRCKHFYSTQSHFSATEKIGLAVLRNENIKSKFNFWNRLTR